MDSCKTCKLWAPRRSLWERIIGKPASIGMCLSRNEAQSHDFWCSSCQRQDDGPPGQVIKDASGPTRDFPG